jgi:hypothetical protein
MSADHGILLAAAIIAAIAVAGLLAAVIGLARQARQLRSLADELRAELVPLVHDARTAADQAAVEMTRVNDVLGSTEAVSATVDSASRLAYRAFANPLVKAMAFGSGVGGATRRLLGHDPASGDEGHNRSDHRFSKDEVDERPRQRLRAARR